MQKYVIEFIGTFFLTLTIALTVLAGTELAPVAIGLVLMAMIYAGGPISWAHYNPAVTLGALCLKKLSSLEALYYVVFQVLGGLLAAVLAWFLMWTTFVPDFASTASLWQVLVTEIVFTFALAFTIYCVALPKKVSWNDYFGLAIGVVLTAIIFAGGGISGAVYNPAVGLGSLLFEAMQWWVVNQLWIYLLAPSIGGFLAALVYGYVYGE